MPNQGESDAMTEEMIEEKEKESTDGDSSNAGYSEDSFDGDINDVTDRHGRGFDPELHRTDGDGNPRVTQKGNLITKPNKKPSDLSGSDPDHDDDLMAKYESTAEVEVETIITLACMMGDRDTWQAPEDEKQNLKDAMVEYHRARGIVDMPPEVGLMVAWGGYVSKRISMAKQIGNISLGQYIQIRLMESWAYFFASQEKYEQIHEARKKINEDG